MGEVIEMGGGTKLDVPPDKVLEKAIGKLDKVVLVGIDKDGEPYDAASTADGCEVLWMLRKFELRLLNNYE